MHKYRYKANIIRVIDGDTIDAEVDLGFKIKIRERFRLAKINAPELKGESSASGLVSKEWLRDRIEGKAVYVEIHKGEDKYGRWVCHVFDDQCLGEDSINEEMIKLGLAIPYM